MSGELGTEALARLSPEERRAFCSEVIERLSELIEGEAPADFERRVEEVLGRCRPYLAYRNTLEATIELVRRQDGEGPAGGLDDESFERCVEAVRGRLAAG